MNKPDKLRLFVAITLPDPVRENISRLNRELAGRLEGVSWTPADNIHLTLKFLGEVVATVIPRIQGSLDRTGSRYLPLTVRLGGLGAFPPRGTPRVIWAGVEEGSESLTALARELSLGLSELGFPAETIPYTPHLTLGRVKNSRSFSSAVFQREIERRKRDSLGSFTGDMIILMQSTLTPGGAIHQVVSRHGRSIR